MDPDNDLSFFNSFHPFPTPEPEQYNPTQSERTLPVSLTDFEMARRTYLSNMEARAEKAKIEAEERKQKYQPIIIELKSILEKVRLYDETIKNGDKEKGNVIEQSAIIFLRRNELLKIIQSGPSCTEQQEAWQLYHKIRNQDEGSTVGKLVAAWDPDNPNFKYLEKRLRDKEKKRKELEQHAREILHWAADVTVQHVARNCSKQKQQKNQDKIKPSTEDPDIITLTDSPDPTFS